MKSEVTILNLIRQHGKLRSSIIPQLAGVAPRTAHYALHRLLKVHLIRRVPYLLDMREVLYVAVQIESEIRDKAEGLPTSSLLVQ